MKSNDMLTKEPVISVLVLAYNHEKFIAQTIQGILNQKTDIGYELIIGEDCSTDNTRAVVSEYSLRYPEKIRVIESNQNVGMHNNFLRTLFACRGKYICICEGDDYWDNPDKLTIQYQFMESNPDYVLVCGNHKRYIQNTGMFEPGNSKSIKDHDVDFDRLIRYNCITTATIMFRNVLKQSDFTKDFYTIISCDWFMYMRLLKHGKMRYLNQQFAVYRINDGSINGRTTRIKIEEQEMDFLKLVKKGELIELDTTRREQLERSIGIKYYAFAKAHAKNGNRKTAFSLNMYALRNNPLNLESLMNFAMSGIMIISPDVFQILRKIKRSLMNT
ncbi:MAG: glycosyltransferase [Ignavibacterium sp.]|nr:glycosyltransferase [Ignavibacterium sp.]